MRKHYQLSLVFIFLAFYVSNGQNKNFLNQEIKILKDSIAFNQIKTDTFFNSKQIITLLTLQKNSYDRFRFEFGYSNSDLRKTSSFGKSKNAKAAVNGGFFDMDKGGSVTYFEVNEAVINRNKPSDLKWAKSDSIINGAIVISNEFKIIIQPANSEQFYEKSKQEAAVLVTGPLLLFNSEIMKLPNMDLVNNRHPRTCLCETKESLIFITIDGRTKEAEGMNLVEAQKFLMHIGCVDAINLDGGGSTTMWTKKKGIVNFPSDELRERPVSNALLIIKK
ncbi:MAG: phosphodiester glycosidase family protein [Flavobacteriaceae bacterium]|nr:phosphodiester glycosidase family protein [Flavobacteriaceae bacterium]